MENNEQIEKLNADLEQAKAKLKAAEAELATAEAAKAAAIKDMDNAKTDEERQVVEQKIAAANKAISVARGKITKANKKIAEIEQQLAALGVNTAEVVTPPSPETPVVNKPDAPAKPAVVAEEGDKPNGNGSGNLGKFIAGLTTGLVIGVGGAIGVSYGIKYWTPEDMDDVKNTYVSILDDVSKLTNYIVEDIKDIKLQQNADGWKMAVVFNATDNRGRLLVRQISMPCSIAEKDAIETAAKAAKEDRTANTFKAYLDSIGTVIFSENKTTIEIAPYAVAKSSEIEEINSNKIYTTAYSYYTEEGDKTNANVLHESYNSDNYQQTNATFEYISGNTATVSAEVGEYEVSITYSVEGDNKTSEEVKNQVIEIIKQKDYTKIEGISYTDNLHEKLFDEIQEKINTNTDTAGV